MLLYHYQKDITSAKIKKTRNYPFLVWQIILFSFFTCKLYTITRNALAVSGNNCVNRLTSISLPSKGV